MTDQTDITQPDAAKAIETGTAPADKQADKGERLLTQAEVDAIIRERLGRERAKYTDYDDLKKAASKLHEIEESQKSETQKLQDALNAAQAAAAQAETRRVEALVRSVVVAEAAKAGFADPGDATGFLKLSDFKIGDDDSVAGVAEAIAELAKSKPYLVKSQAAQKQPSPGNTAGAGAKDMGWLTRARGFGGGDSPIGGGGVIEPMGE